METRKVTLEALQTINARCFYKMIYFVTCRCKQQKVYRFRVHRNEIPWRWWWWQWWRADSSDVHFLSWILRRVFECYQMFICLGFVEFIVLSWPQPWQYDVTQWMVKPRSEDKHKSFIISVEHHCKHSDISIDRQKMVYIVWTVDRMTLLYFSKRKRNSCSKSKEKFISLRIGAPSNWQTIFYTHSFALTGCTGNLVQHLIVA